MAPRKPRNHTYEKKFAESALVADLTQVRIDRAGPEATRITQVAKAMVLCGLPYRQTEERSIVRRAKEASGVVTVTFQAHREGVTLPYGSDRNFFHWATDRAIKAGRPFVPWTDAKEFLKDMQQTDSGTNYKRLRETYRRLSGMSITAERVTESRESMIIMPVFESSHLPRSLDQGGLPFPEDEDLPLGLQFSPTFFKEMKGNHVPFPWAILRSLARKPQMQDYLMFLQWRTDAARSESMITWEALREQLWQEDTNDARIRQRFKEAIRLFKVAWPHLPAEAAEKGLIVGPVALGKELIRGAGAFRRINSPH